MIVNTEITPCVFLGTTSISTSAESTKEAGGSNLQDRHGASGSRCGSAGRQQVTADQAQQGHQHTAQCKPHCSM